MTFVKDALSYKSLSIVGLDKNTGKTECLNYILGKVKGTGKRVALTSIGIDGESRDTVTHTAKPEIKIHPGMIFISAEKHYLQRRITSEILDISNIRTSLGKLVVARALSNDKVLLSGPPDTQSLKALIGSMDNYGVNITIIDGALSRLSPASPAVTEGMVLTTGAAHSANMPELVRKTKYVVDLINLPQVEDALANELDSIQTGIYAVGSEGTLHNLNQSVFMLQKAKSVVFSHGNRLFVAGAATGNLFEFLRMQKNIANIELIVKDFTKIFATPEVFYAFQKKGGQVRVVNKTKLVTVCINPTSPQGYRMDSDRLKEAMQVALQMPVYDVKRMK
ncbi:MAG TPA: hypothetical protein PKL52_07835 [Tenuifilaceae bacterium]|nr:hypothetical protein [Tenuifilaceae bacterium]